MLRKNKCIAVVMLALIASSIGRAQEQTQANATNSAACPRRSPTVEAAFDAVAAQFSSSIVGMCVGAVGPSGAYSATHCYGEVRNGFGVTPTNDTLFLIGSVTKTMTAALLALRVKQGTVGLNDRVDKYLINRYHIPRITLLDLADMESGLQRNAPNPYPTPLDETQLYEDLQACVGDSTCWKGVDHYGYSNFGYNVLGSVLADNDGYTQWSLDNFASVMSPLGMFDTKMATDFPRDEFLARHASGHALSGDGGNHWVVLQTTSVTAVDAPAGGLWSTPSDMLIWLKNATGALRGNREVDAALKMTTECQGPWGNNSTCVSVQDCGRCSGLAWTEDIDPCTGGIRIFKSGAAAGFRTWIGFDKGTGRGVFVVLNSGAIKGDVVGEKLLDMIP